MSATSGGSRPQASKSEGLRVLLVDDHAVLRHGLRQIVADAFGAARFGEAANAETALELVAHEKWDVVILDISLPGRSGLDVLKELQRSRPATPVLVLSMHGEDQYAVRALRAGAAGYVTKESAPDELVAAIRKVLAGGKYVSAALAEALAAALTLQDRGEPDHQILSDREYQVLQMLAIGKSIKEIGSDLGLSEKTISTYRTRILEKMNMKTNAELVRYALRAGLIE